MRCLAGLILVSVLLAAGGCEFAGGGAGVGDLYVDWQDPLVETGAVELTDYPSAGKLAAWYCPRIADSEVVREACVVTVGPAPLPSELLFKFVLPVKVTNPNPFPLPAVELLTVLSLFPGVQSEKLAALCVSFCEEGDTSCLSPVQGACASTEPEVNSVEDFAVAAVNFLSLYVSQVAAGRVPPELKVKTIPANADAVVVVAFEIDALTVLDLVEVAFSDHLEEIVDEEEVAIKVPYEVQGAVWFIIENFGKVGVNFGPVDGEWTL